MSQQILRGACVLLAAAVMVPAQDSFYAREDDRVLFHGGAKAADRLFASFIETYTLTRFPQWNLSFAQSGWDEDLGRDVFSRRPTLIVTTPGAGYEELMRRIPTELPGVRVTALRVTPSAGGGRERAARPQGPLKWLTRSENTLFVDLWTPISEILEKAKARDRAVAATLAPGETTSGPAAHLLMAQFLLQAWQAPSLVTRVEIDALGKTVRRAENATVRELESDRVIAWTQDDHALPMPFDYADPGIYLAAICSDFLAALDQEPLRISGLSAWRYRLTIDGDLIGTFTRDRLEEGINLAGILTPMWKQATGVHHLSLEIHDIQVARERLYRQAAPPRRGPEWKAALESLDAEEARLIAERRVQAQPKTHDYELQPIEN
jgi:hypothetical protein